MRSVSRCTAPGCRSYSGMVGSYTQPTAPVAVALSNKHKQSHTWLPILTWLIEREDAQESQSSRCRNAAGREYALRGYSV